jgi:GNAT superfamily N-acetyltransferase
MLIFKTLEHTEIEIIVKTLLEAFSDYFVPMQKSIAFWENYWQTNRVRFDLSFGVFDGDDLVGFMVNGIDFREGKLTAFNAGTGVIPRYRGRKLVKQLYDFALPIFKNENIENFALEVICQNIQAIKAYQSIGFRIDKLYQGFRSDLPKMVFGSNYSAKEIERANWENYTFIKENYSWEFTKAGVEKNPTNFRYFELYHKVLIAYYIFNPVTHTVVQFEAKHKPGYDAMYHHWQSNFEYIRILNVQHPEKINFLKQYNFENFINQFEMKF